MKRPARMSTALRAGSLRTYRRPARTAPGRCSARLASRGDPCHREKMNSAKRKETALIRNVAAGPVAAMTKPPIAGPTARERFMLTPPRAIAWGNSLLGTRSGWIDCHVGRFTASPKPSAKVSTRSSAGVMAPIQVRTASIKATKNIQPCAAISSLRRSTMSARAPAGKAATRKGKLVAVCTSATRVGEGVSEVISHAAPTFCIQVPTLAATEAIQRALKTGWRSGPQAGAGEAWPLVTGGFREPVSGVSSPTAAHAFTRAHFIREGTWDGRRVRSGDVQAHRYPLRLHVTVIATKVRP